MTKINVTVMGHWGVGKSAMISQFVYGKAEGESKDEDCGRKDVIVDGRTVTIKILGTVGTESYTFLRDQKVVMADAFILVYDITHPYSFQDIKDHLGLILYLKDVVLGDPSIKILLCGNKSDLSTQRKVSVEEGKAMANYMCCPFMETSALIAENVEEAFLALARICVSSNNDNTFGDEEDKGKCILC